MKESIRWPRFSRYRFDAGYVLPAPGARLTWYEPWNDFERLRAKSATQGAAYDGLLALRQSIRQRPTSLRELQKMQVASKAPKAFRARPVSYEFDNAGLLHWLERNGPLGLLFHQMVTASLEAAPGSRRLIYVDQGQWIVADETLPTDDKISRFPGLREEFAPHAVMRGLVINEVSAEPLERTWASYFPNVATVELATYHYPNPRDDEFWRIYAEPVDSVLQAIIGLTDAMASIAALSKGIHHRRHPGLGRFAFDGILASVHPTLRFTKTGDAIEAPSSPSLFGLLALMVLRDVTRKGRVIECKTCGRLCVGSDRQIYCSYRCKRTSQTRRHRRRPQQRGG